MEFAVDELAIKKIKLEIKNEKESFGKMSWSIRKIKTSFTASTEKGVSNWLTRLPIAEHGFKLSKKNFWDSISVRYARVISKLPTMCPCGSKFDIIHGMSCKKGDFVTFRHNDLIDLTAKILSKVMQRHRNRAGTCPVK